MGRADEYELDKLHEEFFHKALNDKVENQQIQLESQSKLIAELQAKLKKLGELELLCANQKRTIDDFERSKRGSLEPKEAMDFINKITSTNN